MLLTAAFHTPALLTPSTSPPRVTGATRRAAEARLRGLHGEAENAILNELFRPASGEIHSATASIIAGALPADLPRGAVLKNGPNPQPEYATEQGGWLDGDGMVHCVCLPPEEAGEPRYSRSWVRTSGFEKERAAGRRLFDGSLVAPRGLPLLWGLLANGVRALQPQKDTANTGLLPLGSDGRFLALMEQCLPSECQVRVRFRVRLGLGLALAPNPSPNQVRSDGSIVTLGAGRSFEGRLKDFARHPFAGGALTAHLKTDPATQEKVGVTYPSNGEPGARVTTIAPDGSLASDVMVPLIGTLTLTLTLFLTLTLALALTLALTPTRSRSSARCRA